MTQKLLLKDVVLPYKLEYEKTTKTVSYGKFSIYPFDKGVGVTVANSLRRVLLSSIPGYAVSSIKVEGINHEFEPVKGVKEDLTDIILAIKKIRLNLNDGSDKKVIHITKKGKGELKASDFAVDNTVNVINGDLHIATLNDEANLVIDIQIEYGRGYRSAEDLLDSNSVISVIPVDAIFTPVTRVNYFIEDFRVGERTDCEKVVLEVWTDGTIEPEDAVSKASAILMKYFSLFVNFKPEEDYDLDEEAGEGTPENDILAKPIEELELSVRSFNCLKGAGINTIGDLLKYDRDSLMKIKNFGKKSLGEIGEKLTVYNLSLADDTSEGGADLEDDEEEEDEMEEGE
jgi:DNA-directed RNA polymerase subunit alpha